MTDEIDNNVQEKIKALYSGNEVARKFFDQCAQRERDASETSIDRIAYRLDISRGAAIGLAQELEDAGIGTFVVGRRGNKSRFAWDYSCISVGQVAAGEGTSLEVPENAVEDVTAAALERSAIDGNLSIADAKTALSMSLGVPVDAIKISIEV